MTIQAQDDSTISTLYAEQEGERHVGKILKAVEAEPWGITLLQLAWTAGPITFIALQGGYYIGYGKTAPWSLVTYFVGYTLIAGLMGLMIKILYQAFQSNKNDKLKNNYLTTIDTLFHLIQKISDFRLSQLSESDRKMESAAILLSNTHALPASVELGVLELTDNTKIAALVSKIELLRHAGLHSRVKDIINSSPELEKPDLQKVLAVPHQASVFLKMRLEGYAPSLRQGLDRGDGFLHRINIAREDRRLDLMMLNDAIDFLTLLYELLNARKITFLNFTYTGKKKLRQAARYLEKSRSGFRTARAALIMQIDRIYTILVNDHWIEEVKEHDIRFRYQQVISAINHIASHILRQTNSDDSTDKKNFSMIMGLYNRLYQQYKTALSWEKQLSSAIDQWQTISSRYNDKATRFRYGRGRKGLRISSQNIQLDDNAKLLCADAIVKQLTAFWNEQVLTKKLSVLKIKQYICDLTIETNSFFDISNPIIQYGIESSKATNLRSLDEDSSVEARALWTSSMVKETADNIGQAAERMSKVLLYEYDEKLDDNAISFLGERYQANEKNLRKFIQERQQSQYAPINNLEIEIIQRPIKWEKALKECKHG